MKILHTVEQYTPSVGGAQEVVKQLSERLVKLGHNVTVATTKHPDRKSKIINGVTVKEFQVSGSKIKGFSGEVKKYKEFLLKNNFDIVMNYAAQQWATDLFFEVIDKVKAKRVLVPCGYSALHNPQYSSYFNNLPGVLKKYNATIYLSKEYQDIKFARKHKLKNVHFIPNGASSEEFLSKSKINIRKFLNIPNDHFLIITVGSHTGAKGHREALQIFSKAKIQNTTLLIIANNRKGGCFEGCKRAELLFKLNPKKIMRKKNVLVTQLTREQTVAAFKESDLFLFPSNIECSPIVLFEAMASRTPFLTTDVGNAAEIVKWSNSGVILPTIKLENGYVQAEIGKSVKTLEDIYSNKNKRDKMAELGYETWKAKFTWDKIAKEYEELYKSLLD